MFPILGNISYELCDYFAAVGGYLVIINAMDRGTCLAHNFQEHLRNLADGKQIKTRCA